MKPKTDYDADTDLHNLECQLDDAWLHIRCEQERLEKAVNTYRALSQTVQDHVLEKYNDSDYDRALYVDHCRIYDNALSDIRLTLSELIDNLNDPW